MHKQQTAVNMGIKWTTKQDVEFQLVLHDHLWVKTEEWLVNNHVDVGLGLYSDKQSL